MAPTSTHKRFPLHWLPASSRMCHSVVKKGTRCRSSEFYPGPKSKTGSILCSRTSSVSTWRTCPYQIGYRLNSTNVIFDDVTANPSFLAQLQATTYPQRCATINAENIQPHYFPGGVWYRHSLRRHDGADPIHRLCDVLVPW